VTALRQEAIDLASDEFDQGQWTPWIDGRFLR
jgi:hypothetical protein